MAGFELTPAQRAAVVARGSALLVSAAAGSGKTRVLVERLLSYVTDPAEPRDVDSFLIITYTRAAAAELRGRILEELDYIAAAEPGNVRLRRQSALCQRAKISTIHTFCANLLRERAHELSLPADFRVADEDRSALIKQSVLEKLLERAYAKIGEDEGFRLLVDTVGAGRDDKRLEEVILELHGKLQSHPWPERWAEEQALRLDAPGCADIAETPWGAELLNKAAETAEYWSQELDRLLSLIFAPGNEKLAAAYGQSFTETAEAIRELERACALGWDVARSRLPVPFPRLGALRGFEDAQLSGEVKSRRESCSKAMKELNAEFSGDSAKLLSELRQTAPAMKALLRLATELERDFSREKLRLGFLDFSDLEHRTLQLLVDSETGGPTETAVELSHGFTEIMVDEYQDVNAVQDMIFAALSREGRNLFMVGDVKQSIYRFRLADPTIFIEKYLSYADYDPEHPFSTDGEPRRILLQQNFRSRQQVLMAANHVFTNTMSRSLGELDYDADARLIAGADYPPTGESVQMFVIDRPDGDDAPDKTETEALFVADKIRELMDTGATVFERGAERPMGYGDIVILMRSPNRRAGIWRGALMSRGIPVLAAQGTGFFSSLEITAMVSLLAVIDNPHQDVPLISVLRSPALGFSADELAEIRAGARDEDFFTALVAAAEISEKCRRFVDALNELRAAAPDLGADALVWRIYTRFNLFAVYGAMADGQARINNLFLLLELAGDFESGGYRGLFRFVAQLNRMIERGEEPSAAVSQSDGCVRIMSIHKSKGLEFPCVFLSDTARQFNKQDAAKAVLIHPELGLGAKLTDTARGIEYPTAARRALAYRIVTEGLSEELRVLYVAMTRARERLYITCTAKEPEAALGKLRPLARAPLAPQLLRSQQSLSGWLLLTALLPDSPIALEICQAREEETVGQEAKTEPVRPDVPPEILAELERRLSFRYPYPGSAEVPSKLTATELKSRLDDEQRGEDAAALVKISTDGFRKPDFAPRALDPMQRGTATHLVMQHLDFAKTADIRSEILRLRESGRLTEQEAAAVDIAAIERFFASALGRRLLAAGERWRELRFSILAPAERFYPQAAQGEELLLQGVVDCCFAEGESLILLDFKTDRIPKSEAMERAELYRPQLETYKYALERILLRPVSEASIAFLSNGETVRLIDA